MSDHKSGISVVLNNEVSQVLSTIMPDRARLARKVHRM